jgi:hypothetical protein
MHCEGGGNSEMSEYLFSIMVKGGMTKMLKVVFSEILSENISILD